MFRTILLVIGLYFLLISCFKDDERAKPYEGNVSLIPDSVQLYQSYFDLESGQVVKTISMRTWELGFECGKTGWHIITNSGNNWFIFNTQQTSPDVVTNMPGSVDHLFDVPSAFPDSTAVGNWVVPGESGNTYTHNMYLLGHYHAGKFMTLKQISFMEVNDTAYRFSYKEQDSGLSDTVTMIKNDTVNYVYYSFNGNQQLSLEPANTGWDLAFGPYYDIATLFGATIPYPVGGSFLNEGHTEAVLDSLTLFNDISASLIPGYLFSSQRNIPGYKWKSPNVDISGGGASYVIKTNYNFIFHTSAGHYYKLKFLSYSLDGRNGFPRFEYVRLE